MDFKGFLLNEILVHRLDDKPTRFIAFRGHLWLFDDTSEAEAKDIAKTILKEHPQRNRIPKFYEKRGPYYNNTDIEEWVRNNIQDSFTGSWDAKTKIIWISDVEDANPSTSPLIKKVVDILKAKSVQYETSHQFINHNKKDQFDKTQEDYWDRIDKVSRKKILGGIGDIAYHGTATEYLPSILRFGLMPGKAGSNYANIGIIHDEAVFLSFKFSEAEGHAIHTANRTKSFPVIFQLKIPDKSLLLPDYDVDLSTSKPTYPDFTGKKPHVFSSVDSIKASKHAGKFGYKGRIPANFIEGVYLRLGQNWKKVKLDTLRKRVASDPWEWGYKYGMF